MTNIPIYRAKKEYDGEYIEFKTYFEEDGKYRAIIKWAKEDIQGWIDPVYVPLTFRIDPTTLAISFDNGKSFIKLSDLEIHTCTDFELKYTNMKMRDCKELQPPNGSIFTVITDKGR